MDLTTLAVAVAAARAVESVAGFSPRLKWPNDLVWPGDGSGPDRKLAGILAEADWPASSAISAGWKPPAPGERAVVVVGIGLNVAWPAELPPELAEIAVAMNHVTDTPVDREDLLIALLTELGPRYAALVAGDRSGLLDEWRSRSATIGQRVRIDLGTDDLEGTAVDVTDEGHLVVDAARRQSSRRRGRRRRAPPPRLTASPSAGQEAARGRVSTRWTSPSRIVMSISMAADTGSPSAPRATMRP